jgi:hypothetical protein
MRLLFSDLGDPHQEVDTINTTAREAVGTDKREERPVGWKGKNSKPLNLIQVRRSWPDPTHPSGLLIEQRDHNKRRTGSSTAR